MHPQFAFYGHHKCATMTINTIVIAACRRLGLRFDAIFDEFEVEHDLRAFTTAQSTDFLSYGNADIELVRQLPRHRGFHIIRDPRDIVVSAYFSHLHSHSTEKWQELGPHREKLRGLSQDEGLSEEIRFRSRSFRHMLTWDYNQDHILEVRFEDFIRSSYETLISVFLFLGLLHVDSYGVTDRMTGIYRELAAHANKTFGWYWPGRIGGGKLNAPELLTIAWRNSFQKRSKGRKTGEENEKSHYRKGKAGDWSTYFTEKHKQEFKSLYPDLVPKLGYHPDDSW
jgi:hypothetical protein